MPFAETWNVEQVALVRDLFRKGFKDHQIGERVGRSAAAVKHLRHAHEITLTYYHGDDFRAQAQKKACGEHLVDLKREYALSGKEPLGKAKARYRARNELDIGEGHTTIPVTVWRETLSLVGSTAAMCAD